MYQGVTFDYDGTVGDTFGRQFNWFKHWAKTNGKTIDFKNKREFISFYNLHCGSSKGVQEVYDQLNLPCDINNRDHPVWNAYEEFKSNNLVAFFPGMREAITRIWEMGHLSENPLNNKRVRLAINTRNSWKSIREDLKREEVLGYFDCFVTDEVLEAYHGTGDHSYLHKPAKVSMALTLGLLDSPGGHVIHVGDTLGDLVASHKVIRLNPQHPETLTTIGVTWGYEGRDVLEKGTKTKDSGTVNFDRLVDTSDQLVRAVQDYLAR